MYLLILNAGSIVSNFLNGDLNGQFDNSRHHFNKLGADYLDEKLILSVVKAFYCFQISISSNS